MLPSTLSDEKIPSTSLLLSEHNCWTLYSDMQPFCKEELDYCPIVDSTINNKLVRFLGLDHSSVNLILPSDAAGASSIALSDWRKISHLLFQLTGKYNNINNLILRYTKFLVLCHQVVSERCMMFKLNSNRTTRCEAICCDPTCNARVFLYMKSKDKTNPEFHYEVIPHNCFASLIAGSPIQDSVRKVSKKAKSILMVIFMLYVTTENTSLKIQIAHSVRVQKPLIEDCLEMFTSSFGIARMVFVPDNRVMAVKWFRPIVKDVKKKILDRHNLPTLIECDFTLSRLLKNFIYWMVLED